MADDQQNRMGVFLRRKRESLAPELAGLAKTTRARTPGLRREDVAERAGVSTVWYSKIERGKAGGVSRETLSALAQALLLDETERQYLMTLGGIQSAPISDPCMHVSGDTLRLIGQLDPLPAIVINDYFDIIAINRAYEAMCGLNLAALPETDRNYIGLMLTEPAWRHFLQVEEDALLERMLARLVGVLRNTSAIRPGDTTLAARITKFRAASLLFERCWCNEAVARPEETLFSFNHALIGPIVLKKQIWLNFNGETAGRLNVYHPQDEADFARLTSVTSP